MTKKANTAPIDPSVLATSNGHSGWAGRSRYSTSKNPSSSSSASRVVGPSGVALGALLCGLWVIGRS